MIRRAAQIAKFLVPLVVAFFIGRVIYRNWQEVREAEWTFDPPFLLLSLVLTGVWFALRPWVWGRILERFGYPLPYWAAFGVMRRAELSRYVPGAVWQYVSRVYLADRWGVPAHVCLAATFVETVLLLLASILPAVWSIGEALPFLGRHQRTLLVVIPPLALIALHPKIVNLWAGFLARRLRQPFVELNISWGAMAAVWLSYLAIWFLYGLATALFVRAVRPVSLDQFALFGSAYIAAWLVGMISMIAPAGMGIRDGVFGLLLARWLPLGTALTVAVGVRLWLTLVELIWTLGGLRVLQRWADEPEGETGPETLR